MIFFTEPSKKELKVSAMAEALQNGNIKIQLLRSLSAGLERSTKELYDDARLQNHQAQSETAYKYLTQFLPESLYADLENVISIFTDTNCFTDIRAEKDDIDDGFFMVVDMLDHENVSFDEKISAIKPHLARFIWGYKHLAEQLSIAIQ